MKMLLTGANGFVGNRIKNTYEKDVVASPSLRNVTEDDVKRIVEESGADVIVHTAAISDIGVCQNNPQQSYIANVTLPVYLAKAAQGRKLVCFSSDQVYSGCESDGPYTEENVRPANIYAEHKLEMEKRVLDIDPDAVMLRAEWMYDVVSTRGNYIKNVLDGYLMYSSKQYRGVTYLREVAENIPNVIALPGGAYNFGSETELSMFEITRELLVYLGRTGVVKDAPPRHNLWMDCGKATRHGVTFSNVLDGLKRCVDDYRLRRCTD